MNANTVHQIEELLTRKISGVVDAVVTTSRDASGVLVFHLVIGPANQPERCDRVEFALDPEHSRALFGAVSPAETLVPCRVGVEFGALVR